jgi:hypothetical protein
MGRKSRRKGTTVRRRDAARTPVPGKKGAPINKSPISPGVKTAFDTFASNLPDETFEVVFDQPRQRDWRKVEL